MLRLTMIMMSVISTTLMGSAMVAALTVGQDTLRPLALAALAGFLVSIPVSWLVARQMMKLQKG